MIGFIGKFCVTLAFCNLINKYVYAADIIQFTKESFTEESGLRNSIITDTCEGSSACIDRFEKGEFDTNEIGIINYDLNDDGKKDDVLICFKSTYFCGKMGVCSSVVTKKNKSDTFHGHCTIQVLKTKHFGYRDIQFPCDINSNLKTEFAIMILMVMDINLFNFVKTILHNI